MKIAIIGAGAVGGALGAGWSRAGHSIVYGVSDTLDKRHRQTADRAGNASIMINGDAVANADVVVLAVPWQAVTAALSSYGDFGGRVLVDVTNPLRMSADGLELALGFDVSGGETVAQMALNARVCKAMNQVGFAVMSDAAGYPTRPTMFVAGDDAAAKATVQRLVAELGFEAVDAGRLKIARLLEPYAMLWIHQVINQGGTSDAAFALMRKA